ncbi:MAG: hypothetical protein NTX52_12515 [Planctomycetota bacterium]|nr:hypothetical protein [Planctomycetota bacterium]
MFKKIVFSAAVLSILLAYNVRGGVIYTSSTWVGGSKGDWETATNWNPELVPENGANTFTVTINGGSSGVEVGMHQNHTVTAVDCYGQVVLSSGQWWSPDITVPSGLTNYGNFTMYDVGIKGQLTNTTGSTFRAKGGAEIRNGNLYNQNGGTIMFEHGSGSFDVWGGNIQNLGTIFLPPGAEAWAEFGIQNSSMVQMFGGTLENDQMVKNNSVGTIKGYGTIMSELLIDNAGLICSEGGSLVLISFGGGSTSGIVNTGTLRNSPGTSLTAKMLVPVPDVNNLGRIEVNADGAITFDCNNLNNEPTGIIKLYGGTLVAGEITQKAGATLQGFGGITGDVVIDPSGIIKLTGPTNVVGDVEIKNDATLQISDGLTLITGQTTCNGTIHIKGGYVIPQGGLSGNCNVIWEPGLYTNVADFNLDGQVNLKDFAYFADTWLWQTGWR